MVLGTNLKRGGTTSRWKRIILSYHSKVMDVKSLSIQAGLRGHHTGSSVDREHASRPGIQQTRHGVRNWTVFWITEE